MNSPNPAAHAEAVDRILRAAAHLFAEQGYEGTSMSAVAAAAGVSKANIFHHFGAKEALYIAVLKQAGATHREVLGQGYARNGELAAGMADYIARQVRHMDENADCTRLILRELLEGDSGRGAMLAEHAFGENFAFELQMVREAQANGTLRADIDPMLMPLVLSGTTLLFFIGQHLAKHLPGAELVNEPERFSRMLTDLLINGLKSQHQ